MSIIMQYQHSKKIDAIWSYGLGTRSWNLLVAFEEVPGRAAGWPVLQKASPAGSWSLSPLLTPDWKTFQLWSFKSVRQCIIVTSRFLDGWSLSLPAPQGEEGDWDSRVVGTPYLVPPQGHVRALSRYSNEALPEGVWDSPLCHSATGPMAPVLCWWGGPLEHRAFLSRFLNDHVPSSNASNEGIKQKFKGFQPSSQAKLMKLGM